MLSALMQVHTGSPFHHLSHVLHYALCNNLLCRVIALRSSTAGCFNIPKVPQNKMDEAAFIHYTPKLWNTLSENTRWILLNDNSF